MLDKFWEGLGETIAQQLASRLISPAVAFWLGGLVVWAATHGGWDHVLSSESNSFQHVPIIFQVVVIVLLILLLVGSAVIMERVAPLVLAVLEGRWWSWGTAKLKIFLVSRLQDRAGKMKETLDVDDEYLEASDPGSGEGNFSARVDPEIIRTLGQVEQIRRKLQQFPEFPEMFAPTRLGNIMRAADARPLTKYGLDASLCWPVLWLLLEQSERADVAKARAGLDLHAQAWAWAALFLVWTPWTWWAAPISLVACFAIYRSMLSAGQLYGQLLEASFDLYRHKLYIALRLALPKDSFQERELAHRVMIYLANGINAGRKIRFTSPEAQAGTPVESSTS